MTSKSGVKMTAEGGGSVGAVSPPTEGAKEME